MPDQIKATYSVLEVGFQFPPIHHNIDAETASKYLKATTENSSLFQGSLLVPPLAVGAFALDSLSQSISLPPGSIHISQEFEFMDALHVGDTIVCMACISKKQERSKMCLLTVDINITNQKDVVVLMGKTTFMLPHS